MMKGNKSVKKTGHLTLFKITPKSLTLKFYFALNLKYTANKFAVLDREMCLSKP